MTGHIYAKNEMKVLLRFPVIQQVFIKRYYGILYKAVFILPYYHFLLLEPQLYDGDVLRLKSWKGDYLHRPDTAQGVTTSRTEVGNLWTVLLDKNGQIQLKSWKGDFLCRSDAGNNVTTSITHTPHTSWTVIWKEDKIDLRSSKGDLLHRPDSSQGVSTWSVGRPWSVEMFINGKTHQK